MTGSLLFSTWSLLIDLWKRTPIFFLLRSVWLKPSLWAKDVQRESVINTHLTPGTASGRDACTTSASLDAINELSNSLSPTSKLLTLVLAVMMWLEYRSLTVSEKDLQYPMLPYDLIPPIQWKYGVEHPIAFWDPRSGHGQQVFLDLNNGMKEVCNHFNYTRISYWYIPFF